MEITVKIAVSFTLTGAEGDYISKLNEPIIYKIIIKLHTAQSGNYIRYYFRWKNNTALYQVFFHLLHSTKGVYTVWR